MVPVSTASTFRRAARAGVISVPVAAVLLAQPAMAGTPITWQDPPPMPLLKALLIFGGIPLIVIFGITLLVMAPSLVRGDRQQRGVASWTEPQWFGGPGGQGSQGGMVTSGEQQARGELGSGQTEPESEQAGGASARW